MRHVLIYGRFFCPDVIEAARLCEKAGCRVSVRSTWLNPAIEAELAERHPPSMETPQIFVEGRAIGALRDLKSAIQNGSFQQIIGGR